MHPPQVREQALALVAEGHNDCEISRRMGIPRGTIRDWRKPSYVPRNGAPRLPETCPRCWRGAKPMRFTAEDYSELLAMYLGDGCISPGPRTARLRIALDAKYPEIIADTKGLLSRCFPSNVVGEVVAHQGSMVYISAYCSHLKCLFPQHGPGMKHERPIVLEPWQQEIIDAAPWPFIRGCIRTDGCSFINRTDIHRSEPYKYLSYQFGNRSKDIIDLFVEACSRVGVLTRVNHNRSRDIWDVRINRRESVRRMVARVGLKR